MSTNEHCKFYKGLLSEDSDWYHLNLDGEPLSQVIEHLWGGMRVFVRYFVSDAPIESLDAAVEGLVKTAMGVAEADFHEVHGSEWTGQYATSQTLKIGGHDLIEELSSHVGKYVAIEIKQQP